MLRSDRHRLDPAIFNLPVEKMRDGYYSDTYFNRAREILKRDGYTPRVRMQVFQRSTSVLCGIDEAIAILKLCSGRHDGSRWRDGWNQLAVRALYDGDRIAPFETVMTIEGDYDPDRTPRDARTWACSRRTRIATNARAIVDAAAKTCCFSGAFDHHLVQTGDGYAAYIGRARRLDRRERGVVGFARDGHGAARANRGLRRRYRAGNQKIRRVHRSVGERDLAGRLR